MRKEGAVERYPITLTDRGKILLGGALATAVTIGVILLPGGEGTSSSDESAAEACVAELVGHEVNLERYSDGEHDGLMIAEEVEDEQRACMRNGYDANAARIDLGR